MPYALFGAITLAVFWKFLLFGHTIHAVVLLETQLGLPPQEPPAWLRFGKPRARVADSLVLLANHLRHYNEGLKAGELRLWNPTLCGGLPVYSDPMVHPFYPPQLFLHAILPPDPAYEIFLMLHLFFSGAAMYWLLRGLGRSDLAALAGGVIWMLLGYSSMWFSTGILAGVSVWGPLALLFIHRAFERWDLAFAAGAGIAMGLAILGSHPQHALHVLLFSLGWLLVVGWRKQHGWRFPLRASTLYLLLSVGVGLAGILTRLDTIANGYRNPGADFRMFYGDGWALPLHALDAVTGKASAFPHPFFEYEFTFFAGLAAVALAVVGTARRSGDPRVRFLAVFAAATIAVAFLKPLAFLLQFVPILQLSPPSRWLFVFGLPLAILAAHGWDSLHEKPGRIPAAIPAAAALFGGAVLLLSGPATETLIGFAIVAAAALALRRSPKAAAALGMAAILFELLPSFLQTHWHVDPSPMRRTPAPVELARSRETEPWRGTGTLGSPYSGVFARDSKVERSDITATFVQDLMDGNNLLALFGVENAAGFEAIIPDHYMTFATEAGGDRAEGGRMIAFLNFRSRLLDAANVKYLFLPTRLGAPPPFRLIRDFGTLKLYENPGALPRAWLVAAARPARDGKEALERIRASDFDPRTSVVLETTEEIPSPVGPVEGRVTFTRRESDRVELQVSSKRPALLVLADTDYPGWEAEVGGKPATIYRANLAFRAVAVPEGDHAVVFRFRPEPARHGAIGSALFLLMGVGFVAIRRFRKSASAPSGPPR